MVLEPTEPGAPTLMRLLSGYRLSMALYVVAKLGVADRLADGPRNVEDLARELHVHPDRLFRVVRALASVGVFTLDDRRNIGQTPVSEYLRTELPGSLNALVQYNGEQGYRAFADLLHAVTTGTTAFDHVHGMGHFDYLARHPGAAATFHRAMASGLERDGDPLAGYDLRDHRVLVDVGGGSGVLVAAALRSRPTLRAILFDLPEAVAGAPASLASAGVGDRCEIRTGSAFERVPSGGDVYVMSRILHDWPDEKAETLLRNCRAVMPDDGLLLLREAVLPERNVPAPRALIDLMMLVMNGGRERTEGEWRALLARAGLALTGVRTTGATYDLLEARPLPRTGHARDL